MASRISQQTLSANGVPRGIDAEPVEGVDIGSQVALAVSDGGLGLVGYLEEQAYETDILRAARQQRLLNLPLAALH